MADDPTRIAAVLHALALVDVEAEPAWLDTIAPYQDGRRPSGPWQGFNKFTEIEISGDRFAVVSTIEFDFICKCHNAFIPNVQEFAIEGRFEDGKAVIERIVRDED